MQEAPVKKTSTSKPAPETSQSPETSRLSQQSASKRATGSSSPSTSEGKREDDDRVETSLESEQEGAPAVLNGLTSALSRPIPEAPHSVQELMELKASMKELPAPYKQLKSTSVSSAESSLEFNPDALLDEVSERVDRGGLLPRELRMLLAQG
ncbi:hypothetical protein DYH09_17115 [bacterium CPR1]|nr:hypothetical protein [bacterium CPR1]